ncbi:DNA/RNA non-specific endonuclease [Streptomyces sp. Marseille-Q5077]|uniref:DNA/RNA non-specific endonuclease n=1 Tax=Streptomyces sp. Marseille-Q5077 TaxID=3418995 RepID=UPI003D086462
MRNRQPKGRVLAVLAATASLAVMAGGGSSAYADSEAAAQIPCAKYLQKKHTYRTDPAGPSLQTYKTDKLGRPASAGIRVGDVDRDPKPSTCETTVGEWGGPGHVGARLIPAGVRGAGHRANVVPVTKSADRILKAVERNTLQCDASYKIVNLGVAAYYKKNDNGVVPSRFSLVLEVKNRAIEFGRNVFLPFDNKEYTKAGERKLVDSFADQVKAMGC